MLKKSYICHVIFFDITLQLSPTFHEHKPSLPLCTSWFRLRKLAKGVLRTRFEAWKSTGGHSLRVLISLDRFGRSAAGLVTITLARPKSPIFTWNEA